MIAPAEAPGRSTASGGRRAAIIFWVALLVIVVAVAVLGGRPPEDGEALSPTATGPLGTKGLVLFLDELGVDVELTAGVPGDDVDLALLLQDRLTGVPQEQLRRWVSDGGTLVVADPSSPFTPLLAGSADPFGGIVSSSIPRGDCTIDALAGAERIDPHGGVRFDVAGATGRCFGDDEGALVVTNRVGQGTVVAVGGAGVFTNEALGQFDNAVLAGALLAPRPGGTVAFLEPPLPGSGDRTLSDLVAPGVKAALLQLAVAFAVYAVWRARRLGHPIEEPQPVQIAGSELVGAVGELLQQTRSPERAATSLREDLRRHLCAHLGLAIDAGPDVVATITAQRTGLDAEVVYAALAGPPVTTDQDLVALAQSIESIREELLHGIRS